MCCATVRGRSGVAEVVQLKGEMLRVMRGLGGIGGRDEIRHGERQGVGGRSMTAEVSLVPVHEDRRRSRRVEFRLTRVYIEGT